MVQSGSPQWMTRISHRTKEQSIRLAIIGTCAMYTRMVFAHALYMHKAPRVLHFSAFHCLGAKVITRGVARGAGGQLPPLFSRNMQKRIIVVRKIFLLTLLKDVL